MHERSGIQRGPGVASIIVDSIQSLPEPGQFLLSGRIDGQPFSCKSCQNDDGMNTGMDMDFFLLLSDRALAEQGNSTLYHVQLGGLLKMARTGQSLGLPFAFGSQANSPGSTQS
jgi:hypothetical protein